MLRFFMCNAMSLLLLAAPVRAQMFSLNTHITSEWVDGNTSSIDMHLSPRAAREIREMYLRAANERKEHAACLYGYIQKFGTTTYVTVMRADDQVNVRADSAKLTSLNGALCQNHSHLIGRAHTHIVSLSWARVDFSDADIASRERFGHTLDLLVWDVTRNLDLNMTWYFEGKKAFWIYPTKGCCPVTPEEE